MSSSFGRLFVVTTFGESHGPAVGVVVDGMPPGIPPWLPAGGSWWRVRSLSTWAERINRPIHITSQYHDEQTGPSGPTLWERIPEDVPKRMVLTNGVHATTAVASPDRVAWLNCHMLGDCQGDVDDPDRRVRIHFETTGGTGLDSGGLSANAPLVSSDFPLPETEWTRLYLRENGSLSQSAPGAERIAARSVRTSSSNADTFASSTGYRSKRRTVTRRLEIGRFVAECHP